MGELTVKQSIAPRKGKDAEPGDELVRIVVEVYERDGTVANRTLELLGKTPEVALFMGETSLGDAAPTATTNVHKDTGKDHLAGLAKRYANGLRVIEGGAKEAS